MDAQELSDGNELILLSSSDSEIDMQTYYKKCETHSSLNHTFSPVTSFDVEYKELEQGFLELNDTPILGDDGKEMYVLGNKDNELRKKLGKSDRNKYIGFLVMKFGKYGTSYGSACLVKHEGAFILLTCAHNVCQHFKSGFKKATKVTFYRGRYGEEWLSKHQVRFYVIHPHYTESFNVNGKHNIFDGVDIAICFLRWDEELEKQKSKWEMDDNFPRLWTPPKSYDFDDNMKINVTGYPAGSQYCMHQYSMDGNANEIQRSHTKEIEGHILTYKDLDTTEGQSGSPVMSDNKIVGVHSRCIKEDKVNVATFINSHMLTWIGGSVAKDLNRNQHETKATHSSNMDAGNQVENSDKDGSGAITSQRSTKSSCCILF